VIYQSVPARKPLTPRPDRFEVCVLAHLRPVKDPLRAALASRLVPPASRLVVLQVGAALQPDVEQQARSEARQNPRYRWLGELPRWKALKVLARCRLMVLSSISEGGANAISEALACSIPVIASRVPGNVGLLGEEYPGYFTACDERELAGLLWKAESEPGYYDALKDGCARRAPLFGREREVAAWKTLLEEL
jgi:glycosyltransferase involved in cell wall biosynthesis